ncbi:MAG: DoxX family membrane protein [Rhodobacteraceae bacterium]|nr:DoxX family membrane protein [Paracoccaceae bacterium]
MQQIEKLAMPVGRVLIAMMFVMAGFGKIVDYAGTQGYMEMMGVPGALLPLVIITEIGGGLAIILGWQTRLAALALAGFSLISAVIFHADFADQMQMTMFLKNVSIAGGFLFLVAHGAGAYALDNRQKGA